MREREREGGGGEWVSERDTARKTKKKWSQQIFVVFEMRSTLLFPATENLNFYFRVKFYMADPSTLQEELTRWEALSEARKHRRRRGRIALSKLTFSSWGLRRRGGSEKGKRGETDGERGRRKKRKSRGKEKRRRARREGGGEKKKRRMGRRVNIGRREDEGKGLESLPSASYLD